MSVKFDCVKDYPQIPYTAPVHQRRSNLFHVCQELFKQSTILLSIAPNSLLTLEDEATKLKFPWKLLSA